MASPSGFSPLPSPQVVDNSGKASAAVGSPSLIDRDHDHLAPPSPYPQHVDPSPTDSTGTEGTDIDDETQHGTDSSGPGLTAAPSANESSDTAGVASPVSPNSLAKIDTALPPGKDQGWEDAPSSVIYVPHGFQQFGRGRPSGESSTFVHDRISERRIASPITPDAAKGPDDEQLSAQSLSPASEHRRQVSSESSEIRRQDSVAESNSSKSTPHLSSSHGEATRDSLPESDIDVQVVNVDGDLMAESHSFHRGETNSELRKLRGALSECWTLCNTLENLSASFRHRVFSATANGMAQESAWDSCWKLCKDLCEYRDDPLTNMHQTIELCRDFTRARFEARFQGDHTDDAMLRVSFEMNSHLYNIRDRTLPPTFVKRTMDFYVAFCHRMMKQRSTWPEETDALLRAGWFLAESLYNLQQSSTDEHANEEDLVYSAIQACWELSDLFRGGWSQFRPERSTPRANQTSFQSKTRAMLATSEGRTSSLSNRTYHDAASFPRQEPPLPPETPVTIFDDITGSTSPEASNVPNILVLGPDYPNQRSARSQKTYHDQWSSNASSLSGRSGDVQSSQRTASTAVTNSVQNRHLHMLRVLLLRTAVKHGFNPSTRPSSSTDTSVPVRGESLQEFVSSLPRDTFGNQASEVRLFAHYKELVVADPSLRDVTHLVGNSYPLSHVVRAVKWLCDSNQQRWGWMSKLYEHVVGVRMHEIRGDQSEMEL